jgi:hypothetical protein
MAEAILVLPELVFTGADVFYAYDNMALSLLSLALQPNLGLGRLRENFRFISVTRSRTVCRTPWTGDQLVARTLPIHKHRKTYTQHKY